MTATAAKVAKLKDLAGKAGQSIYERLGIVQEVLADKEYVAAHYGDESKALETLEADVFGDLCGSRSLTELLEVRKAFPSAEQWKQHKWNLSRLLAEWDERRLAARDESEKPERKSPVSRKEHETVLQKLAETEHVAERNAKTVDELREKLRQVEHENIALRAKVEELERLLQGSLSRAAR